MNTKNFNIAEGYLTQQDLADKFGISIKLQQCLRLKARRRKDLNPLPFIKIGKVIFYKQEAIEKWLEAKQEESLEKIS
ncbi:MAG: helix-turn-helix domain-containing protein [Campylobacter sp.]|nr:helix-turn-helix domain-containing protein [Campylobacter sp.]